MTPHRIPPHPARRRPWCAIRRHARALLLLSLALPALASAPEWFRLGEAHGTASALVFVDLGSLSLEAGVPHATVKVQLPAPRRHPQGFAYRTFIGVLRADCPEGALLPLAVRYYAQPGDAPEAAPIATESNLSRRGVAPALLDVVPAAAREMLLRAACGLR